MASTIPSPYLLVDDMVNSVLSNTSQPNSQQTFTPDRVVQMLNEEQTTTLTNLVQEVREDYWLYYSDTVIQANVTSYTIPVPSIMGALNDVVMVDTAGNEIEIPHLDQNQKKVGPFYVFVPATLQRGIYFRNDTINTWPLTMQLPVGYTLRMKYIRRPNSLTVKANCGQITAINTGTNTVTLTNVPSSWVEGSTVVDVINNIPQFTSIQDGIVVQTISGFDITFTTLPTSLGVGQWICPSGTTCVPQIPVEAYPLLTNLGALRVFAAQQNANGFQVQAKLVESLASDVRTMLTPRWTGETKKIVNKLVAWNNYGFGGYGVGGTGH